MDAPTQDDVQKLAQRKVVRHVIPHEYNTTDGREMQEENAEKIDKVLTMYIGWANEGESYQRITLGIYHQALCHNVQHELPTL